MAFIDHLEIVTPDYTDLILEKSANFDIPMPGAYKQVIHETDGGARKVVTMKTTPDATVNLRFTGVTQAEADTLSDFYYNPLKAYGMARSYIWQHPQTLDFYTVQNISEYNETATIMSYGKYDLSFTVKILGVPWLSLTTTGATIDFSYSGTSTFTTKYADGTESVLTDPPLKTFSTSKERETFIIMSDPTLVTGLRFFGNSVTEISDIDCCLSNLQELRLDNTLITTAPNLTSLVNLLTVYLFSCNITEESLSGCVDQLYTNRIILGGNSCVIEIANNNGITADAIAKIEGTGIYIGDGLKDAGCTVNY